MRVVLDHVRASLKSIECQQVSQRVVSVGRGLPMVGAEEEELRYLLSGVQLVTGEVATLFGRADVAIDLGLHAKG